LRSPYSHARITRIDKSKAEALNGVAVVLTGAEIARMPGVDPHFGPAFRDQPILAVERVCYVGDPVVAVAAVDKRTAEDALTLVEVDYEPLPAVFDVLEAVKPGAPLVHERQTGQGFRRSGSCQSQPAVDICSPFKLRTGDIDKAFAAADRVFETPSVHHRRSMCLWNRTCRWSMWTSEAPQRLDRQSIAFLRAHGLSATFGIPMNRIRVRVPYLGGSYGAKLYLSWSRW
jgi:CO/xanthine dehydrogenase Mo-binding subunit